MARDGTRGSSSGLDHPFRKARDRIILAVREGLFPSVAVGVATGGEIAWQEGFGWADRERRASATSNTIYSLASVTKPLTATGIMVLAQRGLVDLDRPINDYLGEAKVKAWVGSDRQATVRRVANHSSGLPVHYHIFYGQSPPPMEETIRRYGNLVAAPGERYQYSNLGYGLLGHVISRVSGRDYADFMNAEVFRPLGMSRTSVGIDAERAQLAKQQTMELRG